MSPTLKLIVIVLEKILVYITRTNEKMYGYNGMHEDGAVADIEIALRKLKE